MTCKSYNKSVYNQQLYTFILESNDNNLATINKYVRMIDKQVHCKTLRCEKMGDQWNY